MSSYTVSMAAHQQTFQLELTGRSKCRNYHVNKGGDRKQADLINLTGHKLSTAYKHGGMPTNMPI